jgi:uncharacterized protein YeeX (DUF496 family)
MSTELKAQLQDKLIEVFPLTREETYLLISTNDIIEVLNEMKNDIQQKVDEEVLKNVGELCTTPDMEKEILMVTVKELQDPKINE